MRAPFLLLSLLLVGLAAFVGGVKLAGSTTAVPQTSETRGAAEAAPAPAAASAGTCEVLYYRNPMGLPDTSYEPKKDSMGMDYLPVCAGEEAAVPGTITVSPERQQLLGVRTAEATLKPLAKTVFAPGRVALNDRRVYTLAPRVPGWIEVMTASAVGDAVASGGAVATVYSPDLIQAQSNYLLALKDVARGDNGNLRGAEQRLRLLGFAPADIAALRKRGTVSSAVSLSAPFDGVVIEKMAEPGMYFDAGTPIVRLADLSQLWIMAEVFETEAAFLAPGQAAELRFDAYPGRSFQASIDLVNPMLEEASRTVKVRLLVNNEQGLLRPGMLAQVAFSAPLGEDVVAIPRDSLLDDGQTQAVLVVQGEGRFVPRRVTIGRSVGEEMEVLSGLAPGERVVSGATFLLDAESNLQAALAAFSQAEEQKP